MHLHQNGRTKCNCFKMIHKCIILTFSIYSWLTDFGQFIHASHFKTKSTAVKSQKSIHFSGDQKYQRVKAENILLHNKIQCRNFMIYDKNIKRMIAISNNFV